MHFQDDKAIAQFDTIACILHVFSHAHAHFVFCLVKCVRTK